MTRERSVRGCGQSAGMRGHSRHGGGTGRGMPGAPWGKAYLRCWAYAGGPRRGRAPIPAHRQAAAAHPNAPPCGFAGGVSEKGVRCCPWPERNDAAMAACAKKITPAPRWRPSGRGRMPLFGKRGAKPPHARLRGSHGAFCRAAARLYGWQGAEAAFYSPAGRRAARFAEPSCVFSGVRGQKTPCAVSAVWPSVSAGIRASFSLCLSAARL